ncbi:PilZ domain-containing protein [Candidatus Omnitrophota bacterium]
MEDKRVLNRWPITFTAQYFTEKDADTQTQTTCTCKNINNKGICLCVDRELPKDSYLDVNLMLRDYGSVPARCRVIWQRKVEREGESHFLTGLRFTRISDEYKERIFECIYRNMREELLQHWWKGIG